jgi:hypothetical protein
MQDFAVGYVKLLCLGAGRVLPGFALYLANIVLVGTSVAFS